MARVRMMDHMSDVRVEVSADTLEDLYRGSLEALTGMMGKEPMKTEAAWRKKTIRWEKREPAEDLVDFLSEALSLCHIWKSLCRLERISFKERECEAVLGFFGCVGFGADVKAVTHHEALVEEEEKGGWRSVFILDI